MAWPAPPSGRPPRAASPPRRAALFRPLHHPARAARQALRRGGGIAVRGLDAVSGYQRVHRTLDRTGWAAGDGEAFAGRARPTGRTTDRRRRARGYSSAPAASVWAEASGAGAWRRRRAAETGVGQHAGCLAALREPGPLELPGAGLEDHGGAGAAPGDDGLPAERPHDEAVHLRADAEVVEDRATRPVVQVGADGALAGRPDPADGLAERLLAQDLGLLADPDGLAVGRGVGGLAGDVGVVGARAGADAERQRRRTPSTRWSGAPRRRPSRACRGRPGAPSLEEVTVVSSSVFWSTA